jgi:threonine dehydrogenase-like Zn-dependent dehydrogenase
MKQAFVDGTGRVLLRKVERPGLRNNGVLTETLYSVISVGTESGWVRDRLAAPDPHRPDQALGYSNCGRVVEIGSACDKPIERGDLVACGGMQMAAHAEVCSIPRNMFTLVPPGVEPREAAFTTLGINAMHGVRQGRIGLGDVVVVLGTGFIGQMAAQMARLNGGHVVVIGHRNETRLALAHQLGAQRVLLGSRQDPVEAVLDYTDGLGADVVLMCAAAQAPNIMAQCLGMVRKNGRIVVVGLAELDVPFYQWHRKEAELLISRAYGPGRHEPEYEEQGIDYPPHFVRWTLNRNMQEFLRLLAEKKLDVRSLITHEFPLEEIPSAFDLILNRYEETLGVVIRYGA